MDGRLRRVAAMLGAFLVLSGCCELEPMRNPEVAEATVVSVQSPRGSKSRYGAQVYYQFVTGSRKGVHGSFLTDHPPSPGTRFDVWYDPRDPSRHRIPYGAPDTVDYGCVLGWLAVAGVAIGIGVIAASRKRSPRPSSSA